jgi:hypothetical protein
MRARTSLVLAAAVAVAAAPSRAEACSNAVAEEDPTVAALHDAERALDDGDPAGARDRLPKALVALGAAVPNMHVTEIMGLGDRAVRVRALTDVRLDPGGRMTEERRATLERAAAALQKLADEHPNDDAARRTDLAEALARVHPIAAQKVLEDLDARDLMTTPYGYVALARLRAADGDVHGRDEALAKCRPMAATPSICSLDPPPGRLARVVPYAAVAAAILALFVAARSARAGANPAPVPDPDPR